MNRRTLLAATLTLIVATLARAEEAPKYWVFPGTSTSVKCLKLNADGSIGKESSFHQHAGKSVNPSRQEGPHAHSTNVSPDNRFAVVADLGCDKLFVYELDAKNAKLTPHEPAFAVLKA